MREYNITSAVKICGHLTVGIILWMGFVCLSAFEAEFRNREEGFLIIVICRGTVYNIKNKEKNREFML